jgi:hypothetical protein
MTDTELRAQKELMKQHERCMYFRKKTELLHLWNDGLYHLIYLAKDSIHYPNNL